MDTVVMTQNASASPVKRLYRYKYLMFFLVIILLLLMLLFFLEYNATEYHGNIWIQLVKEAASALLGAFCVASTYEVFLRREYENVLDENREDTVRQVQNSMQAIVDQQAKTLKYGLLNVHERLADCRFKDLAAKARHVRILQTGIPNIPELEGVLFSGAQKNGATIQIIVCDPQSDIAKWRQAQLPGTQIFDNYLQRLLADARKYGNGFEVRLYSGMPACSIYCIDDTAFIGRYLKDIDAIAGFQLEVDIRRELGATTMNYFDAIWKEATREFPPQNAHKDLSPA